MPPPARPNQRRIPALGKRRKYARRAWLTLAAGVAVAGSACVTDARRDGLSRHEFATVEGIAVHKVGTQPALDFQVLERIEGQSCNLSRVPRNHPSYKVVTEYEALYDLKLEAADLGANALVGVSCRRYGLARGCYESVVCEGNAVRLDDGVGMELPLVPMDALQATAEGADFQGDPALYESPLGFIPDYLTEAQRAGLGAIGVAVPARTPGKTIEAPPSSDDAMVQGAGLWFVQCAAQGGTIGLLVSPLCAAVGAGLGVLSAAPEEDVRSSSVAIRAVLEDYYSHQTLRDRILRVAAQAGAPALTLQAAPLPEDALRRRGNPWRFDTDVDSVIEIGVEELLLPAWRSGATTNLPTPVSVRTRVRVVDLGEGLEIYNRSYRFVSDRRLFSEWGADNAAALRHALDAGFEQIAEAIVDDLLLAYPLMPGFAFTGSGEKRRHYVVEPLTPPVHQYDFTGSVYPAVVDTLEPAFRWRQFPGAAVRNADFQGMLKNLDALRYELRIYRLDQQRGTARKVFERNNIQTTEYLLTQPLAPGTEYVWSVRARFALVTGERTTRWSGDWVSGKLKGFLFRTPD